MLDRIRKVIWNYTNERDKAIEPETVLLADLDLNSYEMVEVVSHIEEEFNIEIPDRALGNFKTIQDIISYLESVGA